MQSRARLKPLTLTPEVRAQLERFARNRRRRRPLAMRARIVLSCDAGRSNQQSAKRLNVTPQTVGKWRARFVAQGTAVEIQRVDVRWQSVGVRDIGSE